MKPYPLKGLYQGCETLLGIFFLFFKSDLMSRNLQRLACVCVSVSVCVTVIMVWLYNGPFLHSHILFPCQNNCYLLTRKFPCTSHPPTITCTPDPRPKPHPANTSNAASKGMCIPPRIYYSEWLYLWPALFRCEGVDFGSYVLNLNSILKFRDLQSQIIKHQFKKMKERVIDRIQSVVAGRSAVHLIK